MLYIPEKSGHYYARDGRPVYEIPMKTKPGMTKKPTVTDAREMQLVPGTTTVMDVMNKPGLNRWIIAQHVLAALTLKPNPGENQDEFAQRVMKDARVESDNAADFGTRIHELAELSLLNKLPPTVTALELPFLQGFMQWCGNNFMVVHKLEQTFCHPVLNYGGKVDFTGVIGSSMYVVDWKTQRTTPGRKVTFYPEWAIQLAAYKAGLGWGNERAIKMKSVVVSSTEPGRVEELDWEFDWAWDCFKACLTLYYSPFGNGWKLTHGGKEEE